MTYTPDFVIAEKYFIEIKGMKTESFNIKWKLFKKYILDNKLDWHIYLVHNMKHLKITMDHIKDLIKNNNHDVKQRQVQPNVKNNSSKNGEAPNKRKRRTGS